MALDRLRWREAWQPRKVKGKWQMEPSEDDEKSAPGCPWAVRSHDANFCFFKAYETHREKLTDSQIAHMLGVTEATVKKTAEEGLRKAANFKEFKEMKELYGDESIIVERLVDPHEDQLNDLSGISLTTVTEDEVKLDEEL